MQDSPPVELGVQRYCERELVSRDYDLELRVGRRHGRLSRLIVLTYRALPTPARVHAR